MPLWGVVGGVGVPVEDEQSSRSSIRWISALRAALSAAAAALSAAAASLSAAKAAARSFRPTSVFRRLPAVTAARSATTWRRLGPGGVWVVGWVGMYTGCVYKGGWAWFWVGWDCVSW